MLSPPLLIKIKLTLQIMLILLLLLPLRRCRSSDKSSRWIVEDSSSSDSGIVAIPVVLLVVEVMVLVTLVDMPLC